MFKPLKKLSGWQRIGLVLSVAWILYGAYWGNKDGLHQGDWTEIVYQSCMDDAQRFAALDNYSQSALKEQQRERAACDQQRDRNWQTAIQYHFQYAAICAFVPIPFGWGVVYGLIAVVKWIRNGFKVSTDSDTPPSVH